MGKVVGVVAAAMLVFAQASTARADSELYRQQDRPALTLTRAHTIADRLARVHTETTGAARYWVGRCWRTSRVRVLCDVAYFDGDKVPVLGGPFDEFSTTFAVHLRNGRIATKPRFVDDPWWYR